MRRSNLRVFGAVVAMAAGVFMYAAAFAAEQKPETVEAFLRRMKPAFERDEAVKRIDAALKIMPVSKLEFREVTAKEAIDDLNARIEAHNDLTPAQKIPPVRIYHTPVLDELLREATPKGGVPVGEAKLTLSLRDTTMDEALRYVVAIEGMMIDIEPDAIWLKPLVCPEGVLIKAAYMVPASVCTTREKMEEILGWKCGRSDTGPGRNYWDFDEQSHVLTLCTGDNVVGELELKYVRELMKHGYKP